MDVWWKYPQISSNADGKSRPDYIPLRFLIQLCSCLPWGLSPLSLLPRNFGPLDKNPKRDCQKILWPILRKSGTLMEIWYSFVLDGKRRARYAVVSNFETIEAKPLPPGTSSQLAELIVLTRASDLGKEKRVAIYTDSNYAFLVLYAHAAIWEEGGHLTTWVSPIRYGDQIFRLLEAVHLPTEVSVSHCKGHQKGSTEVAQGNQAGS